MSKVACLRPQRAICQLSILLIAMVFLASKTALASLSVSPMISTLNESTGGISQLEVTSLSSETQYIKVSVKRVNAPATQEEYEADVDADDSDGLVATPQRIVLPPQATRVIRLAALSTPTIETVYRVYAETMAPVQPDEIEDVKGSGITSAVQIMLSWGALVMVKPESETVALTLSDDGRSVENTGNIHVFLKQISRCDHGSESACERHTPEKSLYPKQRWDLQSPVSPGGRLELTFTVNDELKHMRLSRTMAAQPAAPMASSDR